MANELAIRTLLASIDFVRLRQPVDTFAQTAQAETSKTLESKVSNFNL